MQGKLKSKSFPIQFSKRKFNSRDHITNDFVQSKFVLTLLLRHLIEPFGLFLYTSDSPLLHFADANHAFITTYLSLQPLYFHPNEASNAMVM